MHTHSAQVEHLLAHSDWLKDFARHLVRDPGRAEDVAQETLVKALRRPHQVPERGLKRWLGTVALNVVRSSHRAETRRRVREESVARREATGEGNVAQAALLGAAVEAVLALDEPGRSTLLEHYFEGLTYAQIAQRQGIEVGAVRKRASRALERVRQRLDEGREGGRGAWAPLLAAYGSNPRRAGSLAGKGAGWGLAHWAFLSAAAVLGVVGVWQLRLTPEPSSSVVLHSAGLDELAERETNEPTGEEGASFPRVVRQSVVMQVVELPAAEEQTARGYLLRTVAGPDGEPLANVEVRDVSLRGVTYREGSLYPDPMPHEPEGEALGKTSELGIYRVPEEVRSVRLDAPGYGPLIVTFLGEDRDTPRDTRMYRTATLFGSVKGLEGPAELLAMVDSALSWKTSLNTGGSFELKGLPAVESLSLHVREGKQLRTLERYLKLEPGERRRGEWSLAGAPWSGRLVDDEGAPLPEVRIVALPRSRPGLRMVGTGFLRWIGASETMHSTLTGADGQFRFEDLPLGEYHIGPVAQAQRCAVLYPFEVGPIEAPAQTIVSHSALWLRGRVVDERGEGHAGGTITASWESSSLSGTVRGGEQVKVKQADGTFLLGPLAPGSYRVGSSEYGRCVSGPESAKAGDQGLLFISTPGVSLHVRALDATTRKVVPAKFYLAQGAESMGFTLGRQPDFRFSGIAPGSYQLSVSSEDGRYGSLLLNDLVDGQKLHDLEVVLQPATKIEVTVSEGAGSLYWLHEGTFIGSDTSMPGVPTARYVPPGDIEIVLQRGTPEERRKTLRVEAGASLKARF